MGYYINHNSKGERLASTEKAYALIEAGDATQLAAAPKWEEIPVGQALVCVVENGPFDGAAFAYSPSELQAFQLPGDLRPKTWLLMNLELVKRLTNFVG